MIETETDTDESEERDEKCGHAALLGFAREVIRVGVVVLVERKCKPATVTAEAKTSATASTSTSMTSSSATLAKVGGRSCRDLTKRSHPVHPAMLIDESGASVVP